MDFPPLLHGIERRSWFTCLHVISFLYSGLSTSAAWDRKEKLIYLPVCGVSFLYSGKEGNRNAKVLNRHKVCPPRVTACLYLFVLFSLGSNGRGRIVSWGNIFSSLHLYSFRNALPQKNRVLKLMILNGPLINLLVPSPPS